MSFRGNVFLGLLLAILLASCNPFAPSFDPDGLQGQNILGDRTQVDGYFTYFKNAYELRDTSLYSQALADSFIFAYFDFDLAADVTWNRDQELLLSYNLFRSVKQISLDWNFYVRKDTTDTEADIVRNFVLNIVQNENTVYVGSGRAHFRLERLTPNDPWKAVYWRDDSDF